MINTTPKFQRTVGIINEPVSDIKYWENANEAYDKEEYKKSLFELIKYINPDVIKGEDTTKDLSIVQSQGSVNIHINISDDKFEVKVPFLKITNDTNKVALFRKVAEVNFSDLLLSQIVLKDDILQFEFSDHIALCHPHKIFGVIREIAIYADDYDDEFVERYKAEFLQKAETTPITAEENKQINEHLDQIFADYKNYSKALKEKRLDAYQWDLVVISILKLGIMPFVNGTLRTDFREYIYNLLNLDIDFDYRLDKGINFMNKFCDTPREEILKDMYHAKQFVSLKRRSSLEIIQDELKAIDNIIQQYVSGNNNMPLFYFLQITFLRIIYDYNLENKHIEPILEALEKSANIDIKDAAKILLDLYNNFLNGEISTKQKTKQGFFARLFR